jgi:hypothetical protein
MAIFARGHIIGKFLGAAVFIGSSVDAFREKITDFLMRELSLG